MGARADGWDWPKIEKKERSELGGNEDAGLRDGEKSNDTRKRNFFGAGIGSGGLRSGVLPGFSASAAAIMSEEEEAHSRIQGRVF